MDSNQIDARAAQHVRYEHVEEQQRIVDMLRKVATEFYMLDTRPMLFDGETVTHIGPDPVPPKLREMLTTETAKLAELMHGYAVTREREPMLGSPPHFR